MNLGLDQYMEALELVKALAAMRSQYRELLSIQSNEYLDEDVRYEASQLTKDGFEGYISKIMNLGGK